MRRALNEQLPGHYFAAMEGRVILKLIHKNFVPNVLIEHTPDAWNNQGGATPTLVAEVDAPFISIHEDMDTLRSMSARSSTLTTIWAATTAASIIRANRFRRSKVKMPLGLVLD